VIGTNFYKERQVGNTFRQLYQIVEKDEILFSPLIRNAKKSKPLKINTFQWFFSLG
jgi:hypothetical protein